MQASNPHPECDLTSAECAHCSNPCNGQGVISEAGNPFCCQGCSRVYDLLHEEGLSTFYQVKDGERLRPVIETDQSRYDVLEREGVATQVIDHQQGEICRVTFKIPAIHCSGCVWLLESLYSLVDGFGRTEVDILRKEAHIEFTSSVISLADVARELDSLGYPPDISMASTSQKNYRKSPDRLALKIGIAGFAFGNIMLMALPTYLGLNVADHPSLFSLFNSIGIVLTLPVLVFSASEFWKNSWRGLQHGKLSIDVPIAIGLVALFGQSFYEMVTHQGLGYLDSLSGLVFFLLIGKWYQRRTTDALSFDRDYQSYFPLLARKLNGTDEEATPIQELSPGDRIRIRNQELIPADGILLNGKGLIDYSFVTGESDPQPQVSGDHLYAGGRQSGDMIEAEIIKPVSSSYLTSLWNHAAFKEQDSRLASITDKVSFFFTPTVLLLAFGTLVYWLQQNPAAALPSMVAVLIVACPCALALSAPFAFGQAMRLLGKERMYLRSADVVDQMGRLSLLLFDKTGTLTSRNSGTTVYHGTPLTDTEQGWVHALTSISTHPHSQQVSRVFQPSGNDIAFTSYDEKAGFGIHAEVEGHVILVGSRSWLSEQGLQVKLEDSHQNSRVYLAVDKTYKGYFSLASSTRSGMARMMERLAKTFDVHLLTGDHEASTQVISGLFPFCKSVRASQSPHDKLDAVLDIQKHKGGVGMIGDGLNDSGALKQSDVGISVTDDIQAFVPACDAILHADDLVRLPAFMRFAKAARWVVILSFVLSIAYNLVGFSLAATHQLTPVAAAILMPISSITIVSVATLGTRLAATLTGVRS